MKTEVPKLRRCCFCIPLRHGLLFWGYLKLILTVLFLIYLISVIVSMNRSPPVARYFLIETIVLSVMCIFLIMDVVFTLVFLIGGHRKTVKLLHIFYVYSIVMFCIFGLFFLWTTGQDLHMVTLLLRAGLEGGHTLIFYVLKGKLLMGVITFGFQTYMIVLVKNEIDKLRTNSKYRFTNSTIDAQTAVENGNPEQSTSGQTQALGNTADNQFISVINQTQSNLRQDYNYNKLSNDNVPIY